MTTIGWTALGALSTKVIAQSSTLPEMLAYSTAMIAVCAAVAGVVSLAVAERGQAPSVDATLASQSAMLMMFARQIRFAESRTRLLRAAQRLGSHQQASAKWNPPPNTKF